MNKELKLSLKEKAQLSIISVAMRGLSEKQLWELYGQIYNAPIDKCRPFLFKLLDNEFNRRKIKHDFSKDINE